MALDFELTFLGVSAAVPTAKRFPSSTWITHNNVHMLVDCGEAAQLQMLKFGLKPASLSHIFISHLHGDHFYGLCGLLSTLMMTGRRNPLHIWHPGGLEELIMPMIIDPDVSPEKLPFEICWHTFDANEQKVLLDLKLLSVEVIPMMHSVPTAGFVFQEKIAPRKMKAETIIKYNIPYTAIDAIKQGADFVDVAGKKIKNAALTFDPPLPRRLCFVTDTGWFEQLPQLVGPCDILVHEATFMSTIDKKDKLRYHCTAAQAATTALLSGSKKMLLNHISTRYDPPFSLLKEALKIFENTQMGVQGKLEKF